MMKEMKAISTIIWILLILCSIIIGGLISYVWVMSNYYNMPQDTTLLVVENVAFSPENFTYFNMTVLNPSNSVSNVNITALTLRVESRNEAYTVENTEPALPFVVTRGTRQSFKCLKNWSNFTGELIRVEPIAAQPATRSYPLVTPGAKLVLTPTFDPSVSVGYFNLTIENNAETYNMNFTISGIKVFTISVDNTSPALPYVLMPNQEQTFKCPLNWDRAKYNVTIFVTTAEGYEAAYETATLNTSSVSISSINFDYAETTHFNLTLSNTEGATAAATITGVNATLQDGTTVQIEHLSPPIYPFFTGYLQPNQTQTYICIWDWNQHRDENLTVNVYTKEDSMIQNGTVKTPPSVVWNITDVGFDLDDIGHFSVNIANMPCSLNNITIATIQINNQSVPIDPASPVVNNGTSVKVNCAFDWGSLRGNNSVTIAVVTGDGSNISRVVSLPSVMLKILDDHFVYGSSRDPTTNLTVPYFNITVSNSINSVPENVTITSIVLEMGNQTYEIDYNLTNPTLGPHGYLQNRGQTVTFTCLWDWTHYLIQGPLKITVYTADGFQASKTWVVTL